jgi:hypothetical protein
VTEIPAFKMADVEMSDAPTTVAKKADGAVEKKKFEVKKVCHSSCLGRDFVFSSSQATGSC